MPGTRLHLQPARWPLPHSARCPKQARCPEQARGRTISMAAQLRRAMAPSGPSSRVSSPSSRLPRQAVITPWNASSSSPMSTLAAVEGGVAGCRAGWVREDADWSERFTQVSSGTLLLSASQRLPCLTRRLPSPARPHRAASSGGTSLAARARASWRTISWQCSAVLTIRQATTMSSSDSWRRGRGGEGGEGCSSVQQGRGHGQHPRASVAAG